MKRVYQVFAALVVAWMAWAVYFGWSLTSVDEVKQVPKNVRENPGVYRSHYRSYSRGYRGK